VKNLNIKTRCPKPFDTLLIDKYGKVYACECAGWLPVPVGNLQIQSIDEVLRGEKIKSLQQTIIDGSYSHCDNRLCSWLLDTRPETKTWTKEVPIAQLKNLRLGFDDSCNLSCPSCRVKKIFEKRGTGLQIRMRIADTIINYLNSIDHKIVVHIGSDGDPFASLAYRYFLKNCPKKTNIKFSIQTNGLLIKKMYDKNKFLFDNLKILGLSIDSCTVQTYEKLRRGGKFNQLKNNLEFLASIKHLHNFKTIFHCVVQQENYREMEDYVKFAELYKADRVWFNRIVDWKTYDNFKAHDVADPNHSLHEDFKYQLKKLEPYWKKDQQTFVEHPTLSS
jgi:sulfatase maturation enzyme AslB (radical SAM superfamily)